MAYADMTAAWHAAAPPPPPSPTPVSSSTASDRSRYVEQQPSKRQSYSAYRPYSANQQTVNSSSNGMHKSSSSTSSLGFDKRVKGDDLPDDCHAPEPERPVSRNAMARVREKERQRARTNSTSVYSQQHDHQAYAMAVGQSMPGSQPVAYYQPPPISRERHDSSPAASAPWSTYSQQQPPPQQPSPHGQEYGYNTSYVPPSPAGMSPAYYQQQQVYQQASPAWSPTAMYAPHTQQSPTTYVAPSWQSQSPSTAQPNETYYQSHHGAQVQGYAGEGWPASYPAAPQASHPQYHQHNVSHPSQYQGSAVLFPQNVMPPPAAPQPQQVQQYNQGVRPLPSPSRSSSISSSVGTGASSPSLGSLTGTVRRSLPQPPIKPVARVQRDTSNAPTIGRNDSVRMAAEEIMARGVPRRQKTAFDGRFSNVSRSDGSITEGSSSSSSNDSEFTKSREEQRQFSSQQQPQHQHQQQQPIYPGRVSRAESASCLEKEMREMRIKEERRQSITTPAHQIVRAASPRPIRAAPAPAPEICIAGPVEEAIPSRPRSRGPKDESERRRSLAAQIPAIFSPPPDNKPPVPMFSFSGVDSPALDRPGMPKIVFPGENDEEEEEEGGVPSIQVESAFSAPQIEVSPVVHVSSEGSEESDDSDQYEPTGSISISVSTGNVAQQATSGTTSHHQSTLSSAPYHHHQHHQHHHHHHHMSAAAPASASSVGSGASCATCQKWIGGRVVHAMNHTFHPDCFVCIHCSEHLEHVAFYEHEGRPYCHFDYHELFSKRCFHCRTPIVDQRYITINDVDLVGGEAEERCYHDLHFFCANCGDPFLDPKVASSAAGSDPMAADMIEDEDGKIRYGGREFVVHKGYPYCEKCHVNLHKPRCKGCTKPILETDFLTALKAKWHLDCFCCQFCSKPISSENFFVKNGQAYDEDCYKIKLRSEL